MRVSRAHVVAAADAERRGIERELHDGVQQHLVALAVNVQLLGQLLDTDVAAAHALLHQMGRDVHEALDEIRRLAGEIYPPLLLDRGLAEALRATASTASIPTHVEADDLDRYPSTVEATVYFCCREALRTARGARATVRVWRAEGAVRFEVADDGPADGREDGTLRDAGDRAEALGGALSISFEREGRRVAGSIPEEA